MGGILYCITVTLTLMILNIGAYLNVANRELFIEFVARNQTRYSVVTHARNKARNSSFRSIADRPSFTSNLGCHLNLHHLATSSGG